MPATRTTKSRLSRRVDPTVCSPQCTLTENQAVLLPSHYIAKTPVDYRVTQCQKDNLLYQALNPSEKLPVDPRPQRLRLQDLQCIRTLGSGGFGQVVLTKVVQCPGHPLDRPSTLFATKVMTKRTMRFVDGEDEVADTKNYERLSLTELPWSPFINGLIQTFQDPKNIYLTLELIPCGSLSTIIRQRLQSRTAAFYFSNIICALDFLHSHGVVHRDLKPDNILVAPDGYLCLADFGYAKKEEERTDWMMLGTAFYMAPEILEQGAYTGKAIDWWAAGCILFQMLAGKPPFYSKAEVMTFKRIASGVYEWPQGMDAFMGKNIKNLVKSLLIANPLDRLGTSGADDVKSHPWLAPINWNKMEKRLYIAPHVPPNARLTETWHNRKLPIGRKYPGLSIASPPPRCRWDGRFNLQPM